MLNDWISFAGAQNESAVDVSDPVLVGHKLDQLPCNQKRKRGTTPITSPISAKIKNTKRVKLDSIHKLIVGVDGSICLEKFLALKIDQLRRLAKELNINIPPKLKKKELRLCISNNLSIQGIKSTKKEGSSPCTPNSWGRRQHCSARIIETSSPLTPPAAGDYYPVNENQECDFFTVGNEV